MQAGGRPCRMNDTRQQSQERACLAAAHAVTVAHATSWSAPQATCKLQMQFKVSRPESTTASKDLEPEAAEALRQGHIHWVCIQGISISLKLDKSGTHLEPYLLEDKPKAWGTIDRHALT